MPLPKRLTRLESRALTQEKLIAAATRAFVKEGVGGAIVEDIAEAAGFSRGAFYSNFDSKEDLFLSVMDRRMDHDFERIEAIHQSSHSARERLHLLRESYLSFCTDPEWAVLYTEFQANALRNRKIRKRYLEKIAEVHERAGRILVETAAALDIKLLATPHEIITTLVGICHAMATEHVLLKAEFPIDRWRAVLKLCFDRLLGLAEK